MQLLVEYKDQSIPLIVKSAPKEVLQAVIESKNDKLIFKNETLNLNVDFKDIKSIQINFE
ncbi:hypothetical protein [Priestia megaterium]|uniref:hypothetical protein n=1 Tax=Priestia megaterium TaxID=1404 RepID=UPI000BA682D8|nr:hypothetical protein [Priestia megaterium]PAK49997.1 hypothetical protein CHH47_12570 [Priestia megaterium]